MLCISKPRDEPIVSAFYLPTDLGCQRHGVGTISLIKMEQTTNQEPKYRLNIKQNYKGEQGYEYTIRADTIDELKKLDTKINVLLVEKGLCVKQESTESIWVQTNGNVSGPSQ